MASYNHQPWRSRPLVAAYSAASVLILIQVGMGIISKTTQAGAKSETSPFSTSSSTITLSEFCKLLLSTVLFYFERRSRNQNARNHVNPSLAPLPPSEKTHLPEPKKILVERMRIKVNGDYPPRYSEVYEDANEARLELRTFWGYCKNDVSQGTRYGFIQLAFLYALINNTTSAALELTDQRTVHYVQSSITFMTAMLVVCGLKGNITTLQWISILFQMHGSIISQYDPSIPISYSISTGCILLFQVFLSALSGVYHQALLKRENASLHADNMILYALGTAINLTFHLASRMFKAGEPAFFSGCGDRDLVVVVMSNVLISLAITAVYKYADAIVKCFATAISTGILLYLVPVMSGKELGWFVLPGILTVLLASWLYQAAAATEDPNSPSPVLEKLQLPILSKTANVTKLHQKKIFTTIVLAFIITNSVLPKQPEPKVQIVPGKPSKVSITTSPFKNTLAMIRWNSNNDNLSETSLLSKYELFFHATHFSMPSDPKHVQQTENRPHPHNLTHDNWQNTENSYIQTARTMELILNDDSASEIEGLLHFPHDAWIDPLAYTKPNMNNIWLPKAGDPTKPAQGQSLECMSSADKDTKLGWLSSAWDAAGSDIPKAVVAAAQMINSVGDESESKHSYVVDVEEWCTARTDIYYIPRRFFADYIFLAPIFARFSVPHDVAVSTMVHIIDRTRRPHPNLGVVESSGEGWGMCYDGVVDRHALLWNRCGYGLDSLDAKLADVHYERLDGEADLLGVESDSEAGDFLAYPSPAGKSSFTGPDLRGDDTVLVIRPTPSDEEMDIRASQREKNEGKVPHGGARWVPPVGSDGSL